MKSRLTRKGIALLTAVLMMFVSYGQIGLYSFADDTQTDQETVTTQEAVPEQAQESQPKEDAAKNEPAKENASDITDKSDAAKDAQEESKASEEEVKAKTQTVKVGGATITAKYDSDAFDEKVELNVAKIKKGTEEFKKAAKAACKESGENSKAVYAFDISFVNKNGREIEPSKDVKVSIEFKKAPAEGKGADFELLHIKDNGNAELVENSSISKNAETVEFRSDAFSVYVVTTQQDGNVVVGDEYFTTLADAVEAASDGDTINIIGETADTGVVAVDKSVTILSDGADGSLPHGIDPNGGTITLGGGDNTLTMGAVWARSEDDLTLNIEDGVHITGSLPLYIQNENAVLNIHGGKIEQTTARDNWNYAVGFYAGSFNEMTGGEIIALGGGIYNATIDTISGGKITAGEDGIYCCNIGTLSDCEINAGNYGIYLGWNEIDTISGGTINAVEDGIYMYYADTIDEISGGTITSENGSAIFTGDWEEGSTLNKISGGIFIGKNAISGQSLENTIDISGGAFKATGGDAIDSNVIVDFTNGVNDVRWIGNLYEDSYTVPDGYAPSEDTVSVDGVDGDFHYFAQKITVTYDGNGGKTSSNQTTFEESVTSKFKTAENKFIHPDEKAFKEWNTASDGSGTSYEEEAAAESEENLTLYAIWDDNEGPVSIGDVTYKNIRTAMEAAQDGDVISVNANCADSSDPISVDKSVTIVAGNSKVKSTNANLVVKDGKKLVLGDGGEKVLTMTGTVDVNEGSLEFNDGITLKNTITVSGESSEAAIKGGKIAAKSFAVEVRDGAKVTEISGGELSSKDAAVLFVRNGTVEKISGEDTSFTADADNAVVVWKEGEIKTIDNGKFVSKRRDRYSAALYVEGKLGTINDGFFEGYLGLQISGEERDAVSPDTTQILGGEYYGKGKGRGNAINLGQIDNGDSRTYVVKNVKAVADTDFAIVVGHGNVVEEMSNVEAAGVWGGLRLFNSSYSKEINVGTIKDSTFKYTGSDRYDVAFEMGKNTHIDTISNTVFDGGTSGAAELGSWTGTESTIGTIKDCQFLGSSKSTGVANYASIGTITGTKITGSTALENGYKSGEYGDIGTLGDGNEFTGTEYAIDNIGPIEQITGGTYTGEIVAVHNGRITEQQWAQDEDGVWGSQDVDKGPSEIKNITGGTFSGAVGIDNEGSITSINGPVKVTGTVGPAVHSAANGSIDTISGEGVYEGNDNAIQISNDSHSTDIESGITAVIGDGRYQTESNTADSQFDNNTNVTIPAGYHVSNTTTALTRSGEYHFLVKDNTIIYDGNGHNLTDETKNQSVGGISGTDPVAKEYESTKATVSGNGDDGSFEYNEKKSDGTREGFVGWNTEADGSGTAYAAGDELDFEALGVSDVRLYAQWGEYHGPVSINKEKEYPNIYEAMLEAKDGDIIYVNDDVTEPAGKTIDVTCDVTVVAGTHKEDSGKDTFVSTGAKFNVKEGGSLTMGGDESDNGHTLVLNKSEYTVNDKGAMTLNDLAEINSTESSAIAIKDGGTYTGNGGKVTTTGAYALYLEPDSTVTKISGGEYRGDDCAIYSYGTINEISGGLFHGNDGAGAKLVNGSCIKKISGGTFESTGTSGRGIMMLGAEIDEISGGEFYGGTDATVNEINPNGYGIQIGPGAEIKLISGGKFSAGWAVLHANGDSDKPLTITGGEFTDINPNGGAALQINGNPAGNTATIKGGTFKGTRGIINFVNLTVLENAEIDTTEFGLLNYAECGDIKNCTIKSSDDSAIVNWRTNSPAHINDIIDCTVTSEKGYAIENGTATSNINSIKSGTYTSKEKAGIYNKGTITDIIAAKDKGLTVKGETYAVHNDNGGTINNVSGYFVFESNGDSAVYNAADAKINLESTGEYNLETDKPGMGYGSYLSKDATKVIDPASGYNLPAGYKMSEEPLDDGYYHLVRQLDVTFDPDGGTPDPDDQKVYYGENASKPETDPAKEGYTFKNWFEVVDGVVADNAFDFATKITKDVALKAEWTINQYMITFDTDGGSKIDPIIQDYGSDVTAPEDPTKKGYTFDGWDKDIPEKMPAKNTEVKAKWTLNEYSIKYDLDGGEVEEDNPSTYTVESDDISLNNPTKKGYTFKGWTGTDLDEATEDVTIEKGSTGDRKYTAKWTPNEYKISFDPNGGEGGPDDQDMTYDEPSKIPSDEPTREGYTFTGWNTEKDGSGDTYKPEDDVNNLTSKDGDTVSMYAQWKPNQYTITFDTDGGSKIDPITQDYGTDVTAPEDPTKKGYTFDGWDKDIPEKMPAKDTTVKAKWTPNKYKVSFDPNGGEGGPDDQNMTYDEPSKIPSDEPTREGYTFTGWNTEKDGSGKSYNPGDSVENLTSKDGDTVPMYAQWKPNKYTITFDTKGGSKIDPITQDYGTDVTAPKDPTRKGYTFQGWDTDIPDSMPAEDMTITAKWKKNPSPTPTPQPTPTRPTPAPAGGNPAPAVNNVLPTSPQVIDNNETPMVDTPEPIEESTVPLDAPEPEGHWALINLICTLLTIAGAIITLAKRREDDEDDDDDDNNGTRNVLFKAGNGAIAVASAVVLLLTENFTEPMQMVDKFTILMAVILAAGAIVTVLSRRKKSNA